MNVSFENSCTGKSEWLTPPHIIDALPPYGNNTEAWIKKCVEHKKCIALTFARTDTKMFQQTIFPAFTAMLFIQGRLSFYHLNGKKGGTAGAPSVLIAFDNETAQILATTKIKGTLIYGRI